MFRQRRLRGATTPVPSNAEPPAVAGAKSKSGGSRYRMVERLMSFGDDFFIQNDLGQRVFKVDGKALRMRDTLVIQDMDGSEVCKIQQRLARVRDSMEVEAPGGERMAFVQKAMIAPLRDRFVVKVGDGPDLEVRGNIVAHEYHIGNVATVSKRWFRARDTYGVEIARGQNVPLILAATVCIDQLAHDVR